MPVSTRSNASDVAAYDSVCAATHSLLQVLSPDVQEAIGQVISFEKDAKQAALVAPPDAQLADIMEGCAAKLPM